MVGTACNCVLTAQPMFLIPLQMVCGHPVCSVRDVADLDATMTICSACRCCVVCCSLISDDLRKGLIDRAEHTFQLALTLAVSCGVIVMVLMEVCLEVHFLAKQHSSSVQSAAWCDVVAVLLHIRELVGRAQS